MKALKAKKHAMMRKQQGKTVMEDMQMVHLEKESSACEIGGMLDTGKIYQVCQFCCSIMNHQLPFLALMFWLSTIPINNNILLGSYFQCVKSEFRTLICQFTSF